MKRSNLHIDFRALSVLILVLTIGSTLFSQTLINPNHSFIKYSGRIDTITSEYPTFSYSGIRIRAQFEGTSLKVKLNNLSDVNYFFVTIDKHNAQKIKVSKGLSDYLLASALDDTLHSVEIIKVTEGSVGQCEFHGFILDEGKTLFEMDSDNGRKIEFVGNSITCGYGVEVLDKNLHFDPATENFYDTYACITARAFDADYKAVSKSGIGIYRNYDGPTTGNSDNMLNIYDQVFYNKENPKWNFNTDHPDIITINLGTNDFSTSGADSTRFINNYDSLISQIRVNNPITKIILLMGPMNNDKVLKSYLTSLVKMHKDTGDDNIYFFEMSSQWSNDFGMGADWHPSRRQHRENASQLISFIKTITDWNANGIVKSIEIVEKNKVRLFFDTYLETEYTNAEFKVCRNDGTNIPMLSLNVDPNDTRYINLDLDSELKIGDEIVVSYLDTTLHTFSGEDVECFYSQPAANLLKEPATQYQLSIEIDGMGSVKGAGAYDENKIVFVEATPDSGWVFVNWTGEMTSTSPAINVVMNGDKTFTAHFEEVVSALRNRKDEEPILTNYPNPFKSSTTISYSISECSKVKLRVLDMNGKELCVLVDASLKKGNYTSIWDARNFSDGLYFYQLEYDSRVITNRMTLRN